MGEASKVLARLYSVASHWIQQKVGSQFTATMERHNWSSHVIEFFAIGTAVVPIPGHESDDIPDPQLVLSVGG